MNSSIIVIPARLAATRLPNKPLAMIGDQPMIVHVWKSLVGSGVGEVLVAAGDQEIVDAIESVGGVALLTDSALPSGTDRVLQALERFDPKGTYLNIINVQGDMPFVDASSVEICERILVEGGCDMSTIFAEDRERSSRDNRNVVKVIASMPDQNGFCEAVHFTRSSLDERFPVLKHVGIYGFTRDALRRFCKLGQCESEKRESLEQLRAFELGLKIMGAEIFNTPISVDSAEDLERARKQYRERGVQ